MYRSEVISMQRNAPSRRGSRLDKENFLAAVAYIFGSPEKLKVYKHEIFLNFFLT
jgi:hypothetical protein